MNTLLTMNTGPPAQDFIRTSKFFSFYLELHVYKINSNFYFKACEKFPRSFIRYNVGSVFQNHSYVNKANYLQGL